MHICLHEDSLSKSHLSCWPTGIAAIKEIKITYLAEYCPVGHECQST